MKPVRANFYCRGEFCPAKGEVSDGDSATYDVIRIIEGRPLFFEDHLRRIEEGLRRAGEESRTPELRRVVRQLIAKNGGRAINQNLTVLAGGKAGLVAGFIESRYPTSEDYANGVLTASARIERTDPEVKTWQDDYKQKSARTKREHGVFEVLLVDRRGCVTEGSQSNVFFLRGGTVYTPASRYLPGITRTKVQETLREQGAQIMETDIRLESAWEMEQAFLTGTSLFILPAQKLDRHSYVVNTDFLVRLREQFMRRVCADLETR